MAEPAVAARLMTADEFIALPDDGARRELIAGEMVEMTAAGHRHTNLAARLLAHLTLWADGTGAGVTGGADAGVWIERRPDTVRVPDGAYWTGLQAGGLPSGFASVMPDLVLEVVSPNDRRGEVAAKAAMWLEAGVQIVWVVWPDERLVQVHRSTFEVTVVRADETLTCEDLLPGFALPLATLFGAG